MKIPDNFIRLNRKGFEQLTNEAIKRGSYDVFRLEFEEHIYNYIKDNTSSSWCFFGKKWKLFDASYFYLKEDPAWIFFNREDIPVLTIYDTYEEFLESVNKFNPFVIK